MKSKILRLVFLLQFFVFPSCVKSNNNDDGGNKHSRVNSVDVQAIQKVPNETTERVLFSTKDLEKSNELALEDLMDKYGIIEYYTGGTDISFIDIGLLDKKLIIEILRSDNAMYYLHIVDSVMIYGRENSIDVTPHWSEPWEGGDQRNKEFEILEDYLIHIKTENISEGDTTRHESYYRINDQEEFYEIKE